MRWVSALTFSIAFLQTAGRCDGNIVLHTGVEVVDHDRETGSIPFTSVLNVTSFCGMIAECRSDILSSPSYLREPERMMATLPTREQLRGPLLLEIKRRGPIPPSKKDSEGRTIYDSLALRFGLTQEQCKQTRMSANGRTNLIWKQEVDWLKATLKSEGLVLSPEAASERKARGCWILTPKGLSATHNYQFAVGGPIHDVERKLLIERTAIEVVTGHFAEQGYEVNSRQKDNIGWDLDIQRDRTLEFRVEVKGTSASDISVELTPNEYAMAQTYRKTYRICIVHDALIKPSLVVAQLDEDGMLMIEGDSGISLCIVEAVAARITQVPPRTQEL